MPGAERASLVAADGLCSLTATEAARLIAAGAITSEALVGACLERIEKCDGELHAWRFVDPGLALEQARERDAAASGRGPLHGVPVGVKDVLDTFDMPTEYGSALYSGHRPATDSGCVAALRGAGAVILGKTTTTEFASPIPVGVRNPHDTNRTPGVSSSGSAAAVAAFMTPLANGTQTGGSVILPAAFCGVVGYKASLDGLDRGGIRSLKPQLDTLGYFARSVADIGLVYGAVTGENIAPADSRPRIGFCRTGAWGKAEPSARMALENAAAALGAAGYDVADIDLPTEFDAIERAFRVISGFEGRQALADEYRSGIDSMNHWLQETGRSSWTQDDYDGARATATAARAALGRIFETFPVLLTPSTAGEAPADLEGLSVSSFNRTWTLMHGPTITLPVATGPAGMPLGAQLVARPGADAELISWSTEIADALAPQISAPGAFGT